MRPFFVPTKTEHPVQQKRQAALSQRMAVSFAVAACSPEIVTPAAAATAATALVLIKSRLFIKEPLIVSLLCAIERKY
jgi:hypothetical protein